MIHYLQIIGGTSVRFLIAIAVASTLAACGGGVEEIVLGTDGVAQVDTCDAGGQRGLIGRELTDRAAVSVAAPKVRFIDPGDSATRDVQNDRLNVELNSDGVVTRVYCG